MKRVNMMLLLIFSIVTSMIILSCSDNKTEPDSEAPAVNITNLIDNAILPSDSIIIITVEAHDNEEIEFVEFYIDSLLVSSDNQSPYQYEWNTTNITGAHTIFAIAFDNSNNSGISEIITVTLIGIINLSIDPYESFLGVDEEVTLSVLIENVSGLFAFSCEIVFDSTKVNLLENSVTIGPFWSGDYISTSISDNDRLNIAIGLEQTAGNDGISGNGILFNFTLEGIQTGSSSLAFENITLINDEGESVEGFENIILSDGLIIIQ